MKSPITIPGVDFITLVNTVPVVIVLLDTRGRIQYVNPHFEQLSGYQLDELRDKDWFTTLLPQDCQQPIRQLFKHAITGEATRGNINPILTRSREQRQIEWHDQVIRDARGEVSGLLAVGQDVTERLRAEKELHQVKYTLDRTLDCVFMFDASSLQFTYLNEGALQQIGYSREELLNMHPFDIKPEFPENKFRQLIAPLLSGETDRLNFETVHRHKSGKLIPVEIFLQYIPQPDQSSHFIAFVRDITERKQAELNLRIKDAAIDSSNNAIALADLDGRLTYVNQSFIDLWRLPSIESAIGRPALEFWEDTDAAQRVVEVIFQHGHWQGELTAKRDDGTNATLQLSANIVRNGDNEPLCMMASFIDISARKFVEQELERERDFATNLVNTTTVIVLLLSPDGYIQYVNPYFEQLTGYSLKQIKNKEWFSVFLPEQDQSRIRELFRKATNNAPTRGNINPIITRAGKQLDIEWYDQRMRDGEGNLTGLLAVGQDVTERRSSEQALKESEIQLKEAQRIAKVGSWELDIVNNHLLWSDEIFRIFEIDKQEFAASYEAFLDAIHPEDREMVNQAYTKSLENREPYEIVHRLMMPDGRIKFVKETCESYYDDNGQPVRSIGTVQDITKLHRVEQELRQHREHLEDLVAERSAELKRESDRNALIVNAAMDGFFVADMQGRLVDCNETYCQMLGYSRDELLTLAVPDLEAIETEEDVAEHIEKVIKLGHDRFDTQHWHKDGHSIDVEVNVTLAELDNDRLFFAFVHDISQRKQDEAELIEARNEAERANAAKSEFLSRMSHELRTPLNAILGFGQLLEADKEEKLTERQSASVREILHAGYHLLELVNEVLDLSRIESGRMTVNLEPVNLIPLIENCVVQLQPLAMQHDISFTKEIKLPCTVKADQTRLKQVLINLLSNAVKYNYQGGRIHISCEQVGPQNLRISIHDTGPGIAAESLPRLFKPFERLESSYEAVEGTGIGLALVKNLVEAMQGKVGVESVIGKGSTFWFELPISTSKPAETTTPSIINHDNIPDAIIHHRRILYVEDNPSNLKLMQKIISTRPNFELLEAGNAEEGFGIALQQRPDVILLDINLPGMDGFEALQQLKNNPETANTPVIAITANALPRDIERGKAAGFIDYLTKPLDVTQLMNALDHCLASDAKASGDSG